MNTTNVMAATGVIVIAGEWAQGKGLDLKLGVGAFAAAAFLSILNEASPDLATKFAVLILVVAMFTYVPAIAVSTGLIATSKPAPGQSLKELATA